MINMRSKFSRWELSTMRRRWNAAGFGCDCERLLRNSILHSGEVKIF